jgi:hypothetical protein
MRKVKRSLGRVVTFVRQLELEKGLGLGSIYLIKIKFTLNIFTI